jgi:uncharacterized membrane protein YfcA
MTPSLLAVLLTAMAATSFLSGIFGMAGGMILMGLLLALFSVPEAMALHAVAQMASNGWRGLLWIRHVRWRAATSYMSGCMVALGIWSASQYVPAEPLALLLLGVTPFGVRVLPDRLKPDPEKLLHGTCYGAACMTLMLLTGVAGPLVDSYFLGGSLARREIVATKAICQISSHAAKLAYFSGMVAQAPSIDPMIVALVALASMVGTTGAKPVLDRLTDTQFRRWATHIITVIACAFIAQAAYAFAVGTR